MSHNKYNEKNKVVWKESAGNMGVLFLGSEPRPFGSDNPEGREKVGHVALWVRSVSFARGEQVLGALDDQGNLGKGPREEPWVGRGRSPAGTRTSVLQFHSEWYGKPREFEVEEAYDLWY